MLFWTPIDLQFNPRLGQHVRRLHVNCQTNPMVGLRIITIIVKLDSCAFYIRIWIWLFFHCLDCIIHGIHFIFYNCKLFIIINIRYSFHVVDTLIKYEQLVIISFHEKLISYWCITCLARSIEFLCFLSFRMNIQCYSLKL